MGFDQDAADPPRPALTVQVEGIGRVYEHGEWWVLQYHPCGHETWFDRVTHRLFDPSDVEQVVRKFYGDCVLCRPWSHPA